MPVNSLLIFEPEDTGHRPNYFDALIRYAAAIPETGNVIFAVTETLISRLKPQTRHELASEQGRLKLYRLSPDQIRRVWRGRFELKMNFRRWQMMLAVAEEVEAARVFTPLVDDVMKAASVSPLTNFRISGIYFRPTAHFPENWKGAPGYFRQSVKEILVKRFLDRSDTQSLLTFDSFFVDYAREAYVNGNKVQCLAEPIDVPDSGRIKHEPPAGRKIEFLLFGGLQARKGVKELIAALACLKPTFFSKARFVICGEGELSGFVERSVPDLRAKGCDIKFKKGFLPEAELMKHYAAADAILAPYRDHIGSSGAIYVAAGLNRPVITQNTGLLGRQVAKYGLGEAIDTSNPAEIARAIERTTDKLLASEPSVSPDYAGFYAGHGAWEFARTIYEFS